MRALHRLVFGDIFAKMHSGFNPSRRNRNIGTSRQGYGQDNRLVVPTPNNAIWFLDHIGSHTKCVDNILGQDVTFIVESLREGSVHPCSIEDVSRVLTLIPIGEWVGIQNVIFRQPTRKQRVLDPAWGRLRYESETYSPRKGLVASGPTVFLDAVDQGLSLRWSTSLSPDKKLEFDRLVADGHQISRDRGGYVINITASSARNTQLYRTLLHEVGHWFDWLSKVQRPASTGEAYEDLIDSYFARPSQEREAFAHRYADELRKKLTTLGLIPFSQI